ncbi:MAG: SWIM zinc finger family protein [Anaerolineae bacterium]|nr:SWIM zinc finger family protein [Anaerolineae bacterium]
MMPNTEDVIEVRSTWTRIADSPWAGFEMRYSATLADGQVVALDGGETVSLLAALRSAGVRLVESVEGWSRVARRAEAMVPRPATVEEAVGQMVARGTAAMPKLAGRLESAARLVLDGRVVLDGEEVHIGPYSISSDACTCADFRHRGGWCKHRLAVRMGRHLVANGFELPAAVEEEARPIVTPANRQLIESGAVIDAAQRAQAGYAQSGEAARQWALTAMSRGAKSLPAGVAQRAGIARRAGVAPRGGE